MNVRKIDLPETAIIGKAGFCTAENNIAAALWQDANTHFDEVAELGARDENGAYRGFWGAMSDESMAFLPWTEGFSRGYYLAGVEARLDAEAPEGWTKWVLPARTYLAADVPEGQYGAVFSEMLQKTISEQGLTLCGAVCDYIKPATGQSTLLFPVKKP